MRITNNTALIKQMNRELIRNTMKTLKQGTTSTIAEVTGLSVATCTTLVNELLVAGELLDMGTEESGGGRPARLYRFNKDFCYIVSIIIQAGDPLHTLSYTILNLEGDAISDGYIEKEVMSQFEIEHVVNELMDAFPQVQAIGIGVPGAVSQGVINVCDIKELMNVPLESAIRKRHNVEVIIENDMNCTVYGFYQQQHLEEDKTVAVATFINGSFPGAGIMIDGHIHRGSTRFAGEIAFLPYGMSSEEQYNALHDRRTFHSLVGRAMTSIIAVLNPEIIALTGNMMKLNDISIIQAECRKIIPEMHMPKFIWLEHPEADYRYGLMIMTLESLSYSLQLVKKRT